MDQRIEILAKSDRNAIALALARHLKTGVDCYQGSFRKVSVAVLGDNQYITHLFHLQKRQRSANEAEGSPPTAECFGEFKLPWHRYAVPAPILEPSRVYGLLAAFQGLLTLLS